MIPKRKVCVSCKQPLIAFQKSYLHPDVPCSGLRDSISIEATIDSEDIQAKWEEMYGEPDMDDYERIGLLEKETSSLKFEVQELRKDLNKTLLQKIKSFF